MFRNIKERRMNFMENPMQLFVNHNLPGCSGCRICEKMCALQHEKKYNEAYSRIQVYQFYPGPIDVPIVCQYCDDRPCVSACPTGALRGDGVLDATIEEVVAADVTWDIEIYDADRPVYKAQEIHGLSHTVDRPLEKADLGDQFLDLRPIGKALVEFESRVEDDRYRSVILFDHFGLASCDPCSDHFRTTRRLDSQLTGP